MNDGKLVIEGKIKLISPLHIGSGDNNSTDLDVIKDKDGKPFITFTSFIGTLKHHLGKDYNTSETELDWLFGFTDENNSKGSIILGSDLFLCDDSNSTIATRDGIKIELTTGIVKNGGKYDYQVVDRGAEFSLYLEAAYSESSKETIKKYFATIIGSLKNNEINNLPSGLRIGAKTNNGLGKIQLIEEKVFDFDFTKTENVIAWLKRDEISSLNFSNVVPFVKKGKDFIVDAYFDLKTSLIQRSYNDDPSMPDASHIQSMDRNILTGSGTKGAIVARAKRIINTIWKAGDDEKKKSFLDSMFGDVNENDKAKKAIRGRLRIEERELPGYIAELQSRIKIDRFTGGTINGALFDSMPLFNKKELNESTDLGNKTRITITIRDYREEEAGLMLLVLKDLWTGDLPIGGEKGIGRGVFQGVYATINFGNETVKLEQGLNNLTSLQKYVDALVEKTGGSRNEK